MKNDKRRRALRRALTWEVRWIPIEVASVALGLFLLLVEHWYMFGTLMLLGFVCVDSFVRIRQYQRVGPEIHGPMLNCHR